MKIPIPNDWDGESWECYQIMWPKSDRWLGQLLGALSLYSRGRYWDETTGSVLDAQAIGRAIFDANYPLIKCGGEAETPGEEATDTERAVRVALGLWELECDDMACIDISDLLKIENGVLYALDHCCNWIAVGSFSPQDVVYTPPSHPEFDPDADPPQTWEQCGKASAVITAIWTMGQFIWDNYDVDVWEFETRLRGEYPEYSLYRAAMYEAWIQWTALGLIGYNKANSFSTTIRDLAICKLVDDLEATPTLTDAEFDHVLSSINSAVSDLYPGSGLPPTRGDITGQWETVMDIIGSGDLKTVMLLGASDDVAVCDCPDVPAEIPPDLEWFHEYDFTAAALFNDPGDTADYLAGQGWESNEFGGYDINLVCPGGHKVNGTGSTQTTYFTWARITIAACDAWVSGAKETKIRLHLGAGDIDATFAPLDGAQTQVWQGYLSNTTANGATSSVEMRVIRDECGAAAYHAIVSKIEVGGMGYDPLVDLP